ncbi:Sas10 C-terminal domain-containing protein [Xylariaceae sp. FL0804]|nr:Sas10 C-terminal domain-containing protein [Xylariaceae sp. FL0804]
MAKKRKASKATAASGGPREYDPKDARLGPIKTYADIADDQERFFLDQDEIAFDEEPASKRQKALKHEAELLENSDEEILADDDESSDEEEDIPATKTPKPSKQSKRTRHDDSDAEQDVAEDGDDTGYWGSSKNDYYNADQIETTMDAEEEEREAARLQKKKLAKMSERDFFDENEWATAEPEQTDQDGTVTEVLAKDLEVPADMGSEERYRLLQDRYPEFSSLADELLTLQPRLDELQKEAVGQDSDSLAVLRYRILASYVATLAMYFAILTSPARDDTGVSKPLDPSELRDHEIMGTLLECREAWKGVEHMKAPAKTSDASSLTSLPQEDEVAIEKETEVSPRVSKTTNKEKRAKAKADRKAQAIEDSLADLDSLLTSKKRKSTKKAVAEDAEGDNSDFGEEDALDARTAADKAARKKSLRFYTSQIVQKANRRAGAGRDAGGDMDIPHRERLRDRQARLMAEAEKRGKMGSKRGADLGDASDEEDERVAHDLRDQGDEEYYDMVAASSHKRKGDKAARAAAIAAAGSADRVVQTEEVDEEGRRKLNWTIAKNKGLAPKRKKENRNSRVKKRKQYDTKQKKLASMKQVYKGGEGRGGYGGERSGLKTNLIKSVKL